MKIKILLIIFAISFAPILFILHGNYSTKRFCTVTSKCVAMKGNWWELMKGSKSITLAKNCFWCRKNILDIDFFDNNNFKLKITDERIFPYDHVGNISPADSIGSQFKKFRPKSKYLVKNHALIDCADFSCLNEIVDIN